MRWLDRLTVIAAVVALLSPFWAVLLPLVVMAISGGPKASDLHIHSAWVRPTSAPMAGHTMHSSTSSTAAYLTIENKGQAADRLTAVSTDAAATVEIHQSQIDADGVGWMQLQSEGVVIPAQSTVTIQPGGYHIMLSQLQNSLVVGDVITLTLIFESGKTERVEAVVSMETPE